LAYRLTAALRDGLKTPFGRLYRCKDDACLRGVVESYKGAPKVIAIGDVTAYHLFKGRHRAGHVHRRRHDHAPSRGPRGPQGTAHESFKDIVVKNPAGVITQELIDAIRNNVNSKEPVRIFVDGEEDLAVIPACEFAPTGSLVLYGQPREGVVAVEVTEEKRRETRELMGRMQKE